MYIADDNDRCGHRDLMIEDENEVYRDGDLWTGKSSLFVSLMQLWP